MVGPGLKAKTSGKNARRRPKLSHLREPGAIEQDADVLMFVHRKSTIIGGGDKAQFAGQAEIVIAKQRNGPVGADAIQRLRSVRCSHGFGWT